jgi:hypothetical protein
MKMIPSHVFKFPGDNRAEPKIFELLQQSGLDGFALHSLNISSHPRKPWAEIDFVCITTFGLLAIEVKGGRISRHNGLWLTNNDRLKDSPFNQVRTAVYALKAQTGFGANFGWAVAMPDTRPIPDTTEHPREMQAVFDDCVTPKAFQSWLTSLEHYWISELANHHPINKREMEDLVKLLRPNFDAAVPLGRLAKNLDQQITRFTEEQFARLDDIEENDQILCRGSAGTGKTFLAIEVAKREASRGLEVLVMTRSRPLTEWIAGQLDIDGVTVRTADELGSPSLAEDQFDVLVVDEGQDLLALHFIEQFDTLLKGGISDGRWRWFMDDQHQAGFHDDTDPSVIELLKDRGVTLQRLNENCRNTRQIVEFTQYTTGVDIGEARLHGGGEIPEFEFVTPENETDALRRRLRSWHREEEIAYGRMAVLVCDPAAVDRIRETVDQQIRVVSVREFKGLEAEFIALVGIPGSTGSLEHLSSEIYTGLTRARIQLWMAVPASIEQEWQDTRNRHAREKVETELGADN